MQKTNQTMEKTTKKTTKMVQQRDFNAAINILNHWFNGISLKKYLNYLLSEKNSGIPTLLGEGGPIFFCSNIIKHFHLLT